MTTKEFIKMLQDADPEGEGHIRLPGGGVPYYADRKAGYWDGPYQYLEYKKDKYGDDAVLVTTIAGYKVDICVKDIEGIVWDENGNMERLKKRFRFEFGGYAIPEQRNEKEQGYWNFIEKEAEFARGFHEKSIEDWTNRVLNYYVWSGYEIRQPLDKPIGYYNCMTAHTLFSKKQFCQGECMAVLESGKFYPEKKANYFVWHYDPEKGENWSLRK